MRFATDTGGTFADLIIEDDDGRISMVKAATVPSEPVKDHKRSGRRPRLFSTS